MKKVISIVVLSLLFCANVHANTLTIKKNRVIILAAGTGNPYFSTDTAATLRAAEMNCDVLFKGTSVDGVYESDPKLNPKSKKYSTISYKKLLEDNLKVMDSSAITLARDNNIPMVVFSILEESSFVKAVNAEQPYTIISEK